MTLKITYHVAASSDGYIAKTDGDVSWIEQAEFAIEDTGLIQFMDQIDGIVMGRTTYDFVYNLGTWPYGETPTWVATSRELSTLPDAHLLPAKDPQQIVEEAKRRRCNHLWLVGGGQLASALLQQNLLTEICVTQLPIVLETGVPLFADHQLDEIPNKEKQVENHAGFNSVHLWL